jgi:hypothetical protein
MDTHPAVIQQGTVRQNAHQIGLDYLAVIHELAGWSISQAGFLNMKAPGSDSCRDEKITGEMSPRSNLGRFACACLHGKD